MSLVYGRIFRVISEEKSENVELIVKGSKHRYQTFIPNDLYEKTINHYGKTIWDAEVEVEKTEVNGVVKTQIRVFD